MACGLCVQSLHGYPVLSEIDWCFQLCLYCWNDCVNVCVTFVCLLRWVDLRFISDVSCLVPCGPLDRHQAPEILHSVVVWNINEIQDIPKAFIHSKISSVDLNRSEFIRVQLDPYKCYTVLVNPLGISYFIILLCTENEPFLLKNKFIYKTLSI